jgi:membrane protease YdiL (CAAX protease family)
MPQSSRTASGKAGPGILKAGLLWLLIGRERRTVAHQLLTDELLELAEAAKAYNEAPSGEKAKAGQAVRKVLKTEHEPVWPLILSTLLSLITASLFLVFTVTRPEQPFSYLLALFGPLLIGCFSPLMLYLIPSYRRAVIFLPSDFLSDLLYAAPAFVALLWLLFFINTASDIPIARIPLLELSILSVGALLAPLFEEIFFREILPGSIGRPPHFAGHLISAFLFTVLHLPASGWQFVYYLMAASALSLLRILTGRLFWPTAVHSLANVVSLWIMQ